MDLTAAGGVNIQFYDGKNIRLAVAEAFGGLCGSMTSWDYPRHHVPMPAPFIISYA